MKLISSIKTKPLCYTSSIFHLRAQPSQPCRVKGLPGSHIYGGGSSVFVSQAPLLLSLLGEISACPPALWCFEDRCSAEELTEAPQVDTLNKAQASVTPGLSVVLPFCLLLHSFCILSFSHVQKQPYDCHFIRPPP